MSTPEEQTITLHEPATEWPPPAHAPVLHLAYLLRAARDAALQIPPEQLERGKPGFDQIPKGSFMFGEQGDPGFCLVLAPWNEP